VPASTKTAELQRSPHERWLIGLMADYGELTVRLGEQLDLLVVESDPLSGTSGLLALSLESLDRPALTVDARTAGSAMDLAMTIATAAIGRLAPKAMGWWNGTSVVDSEGLRLSRAMTNQGIDLEHLRAGTGPDVERLRHALELAAELCDGHGLLAIDHLDDLLERLSNASALALMGVLRAEHQRSGSMAQLLIGRVEGRLSSALRDPSHPLYRAGETLSIRRPEPHRFVDDLALAPHWTNAHVDVIGTAAEMAVGAPAYVWRIVDGASAEVGEHRDRARAAWRVLRETAEPAVAQQFRLLGSAHRAAPSVVCALASGIGPYELPLNHKSVNDALTRMRARGQVFSPGRGRWVVSDPLLAAWARDHSPVWIRRRSRLSSSGRAEAS
jgi:hypothetical protein